MGRGTGLKKLGWKPVVIKSELRIYVIPNEVYFGGFLFINSLYSGIIFMISYFLKPESLGVCDKNYSFSCSKSSGIAKSYIPLPY